MLEKNLNLFAVYSKEITDFSCIEELESFYNKYIDYWKERGKSLEKLEAKKKCKYIASTLEDIKTSAKGMLIHTLNEKNLKSAPYYIDPIKIQAKAECEKWLEQIISPTRTGKEHKTREREKVVVIEMYPHL